MCSFFKFGFAAALLACLATLDEVQGSGVTSNFQVQLPTELHKAEGYDHREALFGNPPYGGSIVQSVYYAASTLCDPKVDYSRGGYPTRATGESGGMAAWKSPFILMVDRGDCTFVQQVRLAQNSGATAVLIADDTCLCDAGSECTPSTESEMCEQKEPIIEDDGSGADITIPSFLLFKQDADPIKETLMQNKVVHVKMSWDLPAPDAIVEYELWTTPKDDVSTGLKQNFRDVAMALADHAQFTPHFYVYDGIIAGCRGEDGESQCYNLCTNNGRYCSTDPDEDFDSGLSGADIVTESLRQICIWKEYGSDGIGRPWWDYVEEFSYRCDKADYFVNEDCIKDAMSRAGVDFIKIQACMDNSGGLKSSEENTILEEELLARVTEGVVISPSFYVNQAPLRGALTSGQVFEAICSGYVTGSEPTVCTKCSKCADVQSCVHVGHCPGGPGTNSVPMPVFLGAIATIVICFGLRPTLTERQNENESRDHDSFSYYFPPQTAIGDESENFAFWLQPNDTPRLVETKRPTNRNIRVNFEISRTKATILANETSLLL